MPQRHTRIGVRSLHEEVEVQEEQCLPVEEARVHQEASLRGSDEEAQVQEARRVQVEKPQVCRAELRLTSEKEDMQKTGELPVVEEDVPRRLTFARRRSQAREAPRQTRASAGRSNTRRPPSHAQLDGETKPPQIYF